MTEKMRLIHNIQIILCRQAVGKVLKRARQREAGTEREARELRDLSAKVQAEHEAVIRRTTTGP
jgi:hypothetical protein